MKKSNLKSLSALAFLLLSSNAIMSQAFSPNTPTGPTYRSGAVGIGLTQAFRMLDVACVSPDNGIRYTGTSGSGSSSSFSIKNTNDNIEWSLWAYGLGSYNGSGNFGIGTTGASNVPSFFIKGNNGNIGVGTNNPLSQIHLASDNDHSFSLSRGNGTYGFRIFRDATTGIFHFQVGNTANTWETKILIGEGEGVNTRLVLNPSGGNVLIGKLSQQNGSYKLDVNGPIRANEIVVNTTGADFVFESNYNLKNLNYIEKFIKQNKHLPEILSAKEMQETGLSLGEMNTKLLQKIEELFLHAIQQEKRIETLELCNKELTKLILNTTK